MMHSEYPNGMRERIAEIDKEIAAARHWGAKLTALSEERAGLLRSLREADNDAH